MPPAFNLSQDQTLQFDLLQATQSTLAPSPLLRKGTRRCAFTPCRMKATFRRVSTLRFLTSPAKTGSRQSPAGRLVTPAPTLIGCKLLKNRPVSRAPPWKLGRRQKQPQRGAIIQHFRVWSTAITRRISTAWRLACPPPFLPRRHDVFAYANGPRDGGCSGHRIQCGLSCSEK